MKCNDWSYSHNVENGVIYDNPNKRYLLNYFRNFVAPQTQTLKLKTSCLVKVNNINPNKAFNIIKAK